MANELGPEWDYDPTFDFEMPPLGYAIMGLLALSAFAMIGVIPLFAAEAVVAGTALEGAVVVNGVTYYGVTEATAIALNAIGEGAMTVEAANAITTAAILGGGSALDAAAIVALYNFNTSSSPLLGHYHNVRSYVDFYGEHLAPLDPGGIYSGHHGPPTPPPHGGWVCYYDDAHWTCTFSLF